jgi:flagellar M-ring protein FliF
MDFLGKAFAQISDLFRSMTPAARITTALLLAAVVVSLGYLVSYRGSSPDTYLMNGEAFTPEQMRTMEAAFGKAALNTHQWEGPKLRVPHSQQNAYMAALAENNALPENYDDILTRTLGTSGPFGDPTQRKELIKAAKQKQLETILGAMTGISKAFVLFDSDKQRGLNSQTLTTASVSVKPAPGSTLNEALVASICQTVARSIAGLDPKSVAIIDLNSGKLWHGDSAATSGGEGSAQFFKQKQAFELEWKKKIESALSYVPGVNVETNVELESILSQHSVSVKHDPKPVPVQTVEESTTRTVDGSGSAGRPGYQAQQPNTPMNLNVAAGKGSHEDQDEKKDTTINVVGGEEITKESAGLTPKRVAATVGIPMSYFLKVWKERNPQPAGKTPDQAALDLIRTEETAKIKTHVATLLPVAEGVNDPAQLVQVASFQDITPPEIPAPAFADTATGWIAQNWTTAAMIVLGGFALLMLRSLIRMGGPVVMRAPASTPASVAAARHEPAAESEPEEEPSTPIKPSPRLRRFSGSGPTLRDELGQLVHEDPNAAANVLRAWIGNSMGAKT